jgi:hypothetical protein
MTLKEQYFKLLSLSQYHHDDWEAKDAAAREALDRGVAIEALLEQCRQDCIKKGVVIVGMTEDGRMVNLDGSPATPRKFICGPYSKE